MLLGVVKNCFVFLFFSGVLLVDGSVSIGLWSWEFRGWAAGTISSSVSSSDRSFCGGVVRLRSTTGRFMGGFLAGFAGVVVGVFLGDLAGVLVLRFGVGGVLRFRLVMLFCFLVVVVVVG